MTIVYKYIKTIRIITVVLVSAMFSNCVEPFEVEIEDFENILVINTTITNEVKRQQVLLTRTFKFEDNGPLSEQSATVKIIEDSNVEYLFEEPAPGVYRSVQEFAASPGKEYQLSITTLDGKSYLSDKVILPQETPIERVYPKRMINDKGVEGVGILVDAFDPTGSSQYYRYEYEETYRIIAPFWVPVDIITFTEDGEIMFDFVDRPEAQKVCYKSNISNEIISTTTTAFGEDRLTGFSINFIDAGDISIADRYSVLVRQYVQSREANGFYETLNSFSESESLFSQIQPGFITGNIVSEDNPEEQVLGFFDVSSVSEKRIFFNHDDILEDLEPFALECNRILPVPDPLDTEETFLEKLRDFIIGGLLKFLENAPEDSAGPYVFVNRPCGDCTVLGKSTVPEFWVD